jgi:putative transposase
VHLLLTPLSPDSLPRTMQSLGRRYVRYVNGAYRRTGTLWEGRYRAAPIDSEAYFLACCRYIELNPVRARMVGHPREYRWSSYRAHAQGATDRLLTGHELYDRLARTPAERQKQYRALFRTALDPDFVDSLRAATNGGWALGDARFKQQIAKALGRRVAPLPRGRPRKAKATRRQIKSTLTPIPLTPPRLLHRAMSRRRAAAQHVVCSLLLTVHSNVSMSPKDFLAG